jgi:hypothetical protein
VVLLIQQSTLNHAKATQVPLFAVGATPDFQDWESKFFPSSPRSLKALTPPPAPKFPDLHKSRGLSWSRLGVRTPRSPGQCRPWFAESTDEIVDNFRSCALAIHIHRHTYRPPNGNLSRGNTNCRHLPSSSILLIQ